MENRRWGYNNCRTPEIQEKVHRYYEGQINRMETMYIRPMGRKVADRYGIHQSYAMQRVWEEVLCNLEANLRLHSRREAEKNEKKSNPIIAFFRPKRKRNVA